MHRFLSFALASSLLIAGCGSAPDRQVRPPVGGGEVACTMDARMCPDGSYVGRVPPTCEFAPCPGKTSGKQPGDVALGGTVTLAGLMITPMKVLEDSRCPADVACVWAGTVKVLVRVNGDEALPLVTLELGKPTEVDGMDVTLVAVKPSPNSKTKIADSDYRFNFMVTPIAP